MHNDGINIKGGGGTEDEPTGATGHAADSVAEHVFDHVEERPWFRRLAQLGWVAKGIVYGSLGWAAIEISVAKSAPEDADYTGIVTALARGGLTRVLLALISFGLIFYILFRLVSIALIDAVDLDAWAHRVAYLFSVVTYVTIAWAAGAAALSGPRPDDGSRVEQVSRSLLNSTPGRVLLVVGGLGALGVGAYFVVKGVTRRFMCQIDLDDIGTTERRLIEYSGAVGWVGRGLTVSVVALFVTWAAIQADPSDARGLDSSMHRVANGAFGQVLVMIIGLALLVYAGYCILSARRRRLAWDDNPEPATNHHTKAGVPT